jgi:hypothetical protein
MTYAWREIHPAAAGVFNAAWIINAPWAHPVWHQYAMLLYDLTTPHPDGPSIIHLPGATHEFLLYALDPAHPVAKDAPIHKITIRRLHPANYGYQFKADSNDAALERVQAIVDAIVAERLSPDTDFRQQWNQLFPDCYPLTISAWL